MAPALLKEMEAQTTLVALGEHHPAARVEARVGDAAAARGGGAGAPAGADTTRNLLIHDVFLVTF